MEGDETDEGPAAEDTAETRQQEEEASEPQGGEESNYGEEEGEGEERRPQTKKTYSKCFLKCNQRIDELATPNKRMFLALWNEHAHHLPEEKVVNLKLILQQLYAMSPEETAKYFAELRAQAKAALERRKLKQKLRKYLKQKNKEKQRERAYCLFKKLLKCGITYAVENPVPPLVSIRLRHLSNIILEQLCELRKVEVPDRSLQDCPHLSNEAKQGKFLIAVADWMAIAMERLHYAAQVSIDELTGRVLPVDTCECIADVPCGTSLEGEPLANSTPIRLPSDSFSRLFGEPQAASTPRQSPMKLPHDSTFGSFGAPQAASTPRQSPIKLPHDSTFGAPKAASTPKQSPIKLPHDSTFGAPQAASTPKQSPTKLPPGSSTRPLGASKTSSMQMKTKYSHQDHLVEECPAKLPYYSFIEDEKTTSHGTKFNTTGAYKTSEFTKWSEGASHAKGHFELPPYSFKGVDPRSKRHNTTKDSRIWSRTVTERETLGEERGFFVGLGLMLANEYRGEIVEGAKKGVNYVKEKIKH